MCSKNTLQVLLDETVRGLRDIFGERLDSVILYGSYARGDYDEESDIDVMALVKMDREELTGYRRRRAMEVYYVKNRSLWLDIKIIFMTFATVFTGRGSR